MIFRHHALKLGGTVLAPAIALIPARGLHWSVDAGLNLAYFVGLLALCTGVMHSRSKRFNCPHCRTKPETVLRRLHNRIAFAFGRHGGPPLAVVAFLILLGPVVMPLPPRGPEAPESAYQWHASITVAVVFLIVPAFFSANAFYRRHRGLDHPSMVSAFAARAKRLTHRVHWLVLAANVAFVVTVALPETTWSNALLALIAVANVALTTLQMHHSQSLCEVCVTEWPVDAPEKAEAKRWRLKAVHTQGRALTFGILLLVLTAVVTPQPWSAVFYVPAFAVLAGSSFLLRFHSNFQPWCPYCRRGGGSDETIEANPDGGPHGRPLPLNDPFPSGSRA